MKIAGEVVIAGIIIGLIVLSVVALWLYELRYEILIAGGAYVLWKVGKNNGVHTALMPRRSDPKRKG